MYCKYGGHTRLQFLCGSRAHPCGREQQSRPHSALWCERDSGQGNLKRRRGGLRIHRISGCDRGRVHPCGGEGLRLEAQCGLLRGLQPRENQPRRQAAHGGEDKESHFRLHTRDWPLGQRGLQFGNHGRHAPCPEHQGGRGHKNSQRDINIAFVNELSKIFSRLGIDTQDVLEAASTKWNFLPFKPGLVGGHCIGVDPYYLAQCAQRHGYNPEIILAGRRMNDGMGEYVANETIKLMLKKGIQVLESNILILGFTFKENCPDVRNTKVIDIYKALKEYNVNVTVYDPWANPDTVRHEYGMDVTNELPAAKFDTAILAVAHKKFETLDVPSLLKDRHVIYDVKAFLNRKIIDGRL